MLNSQHFWVITTDSNTCKIYQYKKPSELTLVKEIQHPENKLRDIELTSDKPGHYKSNGTTHGAYSQETDPKETKIEEFTREVAKELEHGRNVHAYQNLILIASSHMTGMLFQYITKQVKELISKNIQKDVSHLSNHELLEFLRTNTKYID